MNSGSNLFLSKKITLTKNMKKAYRWYGIVIIATVIYLSGCGPLPRSQSSLQGADDRLERRVDSVLTKMSLAEKIGQISQRGTSSRVRGGLSEELKQAVRDGKIGSMLNVMNTEYVRELQRIAVEESPNGIPLIFGRDVIHGFKTIFPIPLAQAATFNPDIVEKGAEVAAREASTSGIKWTFAPMLDISRDPRWGRIAESSGEDTYLTEVMAKAAIRGFQGDDLTEKSRIAACAKHFAAYGAAEGGRDYNTAMVSDDQLQNAYLRPFKAAVDARAATFMTSFNDLNGVPASGNKFLLQDMLRGTWGFDGFVVSDWNSITEMIPHGFCADGKEAAEKAANAGLDMEMMSTAYEDHISALIDEGKFSVPQLDEMVKNILRIKFRLGLFDDATFDDDKTVLYAEDHLASAKQAAIESVVLLKNEKNILPLKMNGKVAVIGPMADAPHDQLGTWTFDGEKDNTRTPLAALRESLGAKNVLYASGLAYSRDQSTKGFAKARQQAAASDVILFFAGEEAILSGEAHSRANIDLPGAQEELIRDLAKLGKPMVLIIMAGRPITLGNIIDKAGAIMHAWHPGTMGGPALSDLLLGKAVPSGRLPVSYPKTVGQIPIHYNHKSTGRPPSADRFVHIDDIPIGAWQSSLGNESHYLDDGFEPLFPFGYGLSYTNFEYADLSLSQTGIGEGETLEISLTVRNTGDLTASEVVQLYFQDVSASITRPVKELVRFKKIEIAAGQETKVNFTLSTDDLQFYNPLSGQWTTEAGEFKVWAGANAASGLEASFSVN